jgi:hypothetical protein
LQNRYLQDVSHLRFGMKSWSDLQC